MEQPILIQGAMHCELALLQAKLENSREIKIGDFSFFQGTLGGQPVVLSLMGIGFVRTAAATILGIQTFAPKAIINQGTAGGYTLDLHNYDIVVGQRYFNAGAIFTAPDHTDKTDLDWQYMDIEKLEAARSLAACIGPKPFYTNCDKDLVKKIMALAVGYTKGGVITGTVASAEEWNSDPALLTKLHKATGAHCEEMETAAAGQIAQGEKVPFVCVKIISDNHLTGENFDVKTAAALQEFILGLF